MHLWNTLEDPSSPTTPTNPRPTFQVKYVGKVLVTSKKAPPAFIDEAVEKFEELSKVRWNGGDGGSQWRDENDDGGVAGDDDDDGVADDDEDRMAGDNDDDGGCGGR